MLDGTNLRRSWYEALDGAQNHFRQLLTSHSSNDWKRVSVEGSQNGLKGKARAAAGPQLADVILHRKVEKGASVYRAVLDVSATDDAPLSLDACKAVLVTPELRKEWDPAVEKSQLLEMFDQATRICKTNFTLGWPASPRDAVTISRTFNDTTTLIDVSTSLPRSPDEPAYLRPAPPYVRSEVGLFAWCIQLVSSVGGITRLRITCFWQHDLRAMWTGGFGSATSTAQQLGSMMVGFYNTVKTRGVSRVPVLSGYGHGISIERVRFQLDREALTVDYAIVPEDQDDDHRHQHEGEQGLEELHALREHRRLTRSVEWVLPTGEGWDVQITTKASSEHVAKLPWTAHATRSRASGSKDPEKVVLNVKHSELPNDHTVLKVRVVIELSGPSSGWRLNGIPQPVEEVEERDPTSYFMNQPILQDTTSMAELSFRTKSTVNTVTTVGSSSSTIPEPVGRNATMERTPAAERSILSRVKRNYIYFSSLLQEPEAKWKRTTEARGVSVAQLDSIDPTLVVYRAEATFVGLGLWDLYAAIATPGARAYWDKLYEDSVLLEDVNELTELWHYKTKPTWPVNGRDTVVLKTVYKSPTTIHVFAFSADDPNLFPHIPPADPNVIRTQVDLQGWAIEALSPTTTLVTLLEQSDPKGWSNKASIPQQMIAALAGVGDFVIKCGGPPVATRLEGAKANDMRYDHDKGSFRIEYEGCASRRGSNGENNDEPVTPNPIIECELRCDMKNWASSLDIVIDPPPQGITCLRRHRLSSGGGGLWLTINHDAVHVGDERLQAIVRRAPQGVAKEKGLVFVNGAKVDVDVEELADKEVKHLAKQKRVKPARVPLDQPPVLRVIRRRRAEWEAIEIDGNASDTNSAGSPTRTTYTTTAPAFASAFSRYWSYAVEQATVTTQQAVAAISPANASGTDVVPSSTKQPMQYALEALAYIESLHASQGNDGWTLINDKGFPVYRKIEPEISSIIPVHKGEKVIEGVSADEVASVITSYESRKQWDTRFDSVHTLESFGAESHTAFVVTKGGFPFRDRGFYLANVLARTTLARRPSGESEQAADGRTTIFLVSASFSPESAQAFARTKYNQYNLPVGRVFVDGWILETLDPYGSENYAIPSTRCTRVVAVDYSGSIPAAVNSSINAMLPRSVLALETYLKGVSPPPYTRLPASGLMIAGKAENSVVEHSWTLRKRDPMRAIVVAKYMPGDRMYYNTLLLNIAPSAAAPDKAPRTGQQSASPRTPLHPERPEDSSTTSSEAQTSPTAPAKASSPTSDRSRGSEALKSSSMFTVRGEVRHPTDLIVGELVVDTKLYPEGYTASIRSRIDNGQTRLSLPCSVDDLPSGNPLPIVTSVYTLPSSPLHSSGLNADRPPCHLLRMMLPTAQYQMSTIQDPLTGETRSAPPKPQWLLDLEDGRAVIAVVIQPASPTSGDKKTVLSVDGKDVNVLSEKESLTILGRDELLDGRTSKMDLLIRSSSEEQLPRELQSPLAIAEHLLDDSAPPTTEAQPPDQTEGESTDSPSADNPVTDEKLPPEAPTVNEAAPPDSAASGLLRFLNSYPNPLTRFTAPNGGVLRTLSGAAAAAARQGAGAGTREVGEASRAPGQQQVASLTPRPDTAPTYPLSTVIIVALMAFLIGSLLRSMLSPADFVYVVSDLGDAVGSGDVSGSWREMKRLFEVKYVVGGWDFQVALVRRH